MPPTRLAAALLSCVMLHAAPALAKDDAYRDDRTDGVSLIQSYYNAINRKEYVRAWDYFAEDGKPAASFKDFAEGFSGTEHVDLATGPMSVEGAAGSHFHSVPVAIRATDAAGTERVFAGCYTARLADPGVQEPPFQELRIVEGSLEPAEEPLADAVPARCGDAPAPNAQDELVHRARALFGSTRGDECTGPTLDESPAPDVHTLSFRPGYADENAPPEEATLIRFFCMAGAYNEMHVYYLSTQLDGLRELSFADPELDIRYQGDDSEMPVEEMRVIGFTSRAVLVNSDFVPEDQTIVEHSKWRGVGDASSTGLWLFRDGDFTLVKYEVDATYDGEINPQIVLDYYSAP